VIVGFAPEIRAQAEAREKLMEMTMLEPEEERRSAIVDDA